MGAYPDEYMLEKLAQFVRELGHFPVKNELRIKRRGDSDFPSSNAYGRLGSKDELVAKVFLFCQTRPEYTDVAELIEPLVVTPADSFEANSATKYIISYGFVYLVKGHPGEYKIGRTNLVDRRLSELGATASIQQSLVHEIKTDDPTGVEAYWHKRFQDKRMRGEWFKLNAADVRTFKRWRKIY